MVRPSRYVIGCVILILTVNTLITTASARGLKKTSSEDDDARYAYLDDDYDGDDDDDYNDDDKWYDDDYDTQKTNFLGAEQQSNNEKNDAAGAIGIWAAIAVVVGVALVVVAVRHSRLHTRRDANLGLVRTNDDDSITERANVWREYVVEMNEKHIQGESESDRSSAKDDCASVTPSSNLGSDWGQVFDAYDVLAQKHGWGQDTPSQQQQQHQHQQNAQTDGIIIAPQPTSMKSKLLLSQKREAFIRKCEEKCIPIETVFTRSKGLTNHFSFIKAMHEMQELDDATSSATLENDTTVEDTTIQIPLEDQVSKLVADTV